MQDIATTHTPEVLTSSALAARIIQEHQDCERSYRNALQHALRCGELLSLAKRELDHGQWLLWLQNYCPIPERTVQLYMKLHRELPDRVAVQALPENATVADLSMRQAVKLLSRPDDDDEVEYGEMEGGEDESIGEQERVSMDRATAFRNLVYAAREADRYVGWPDLGSRARFLRSALAELAGLDARDAKRTAKSLGNWSAPFKTVADEHKR